MFSARISRQALVTLLIVCFLRATLPFETESLEARRAPASGVAIEALDFPCAGHQCGCHTREHCLAACCCFPKRMGERDPARDASRASEALGSVAARVGVNASDRVAELAPRTVESGSSRTVAFVQALKCSGGAPQSVASSSTFFSTEPQRASFGSIDESSQADEHVVALLVEGRRPDPSTPPPRARAS
jgi:hypothetical protein